MSKGKPKIRVSQVLCNFAFLLPAFAAFILYKALPSHPKFTERFFSRGIFRVLGSLLGFLTSRLGFSLTELLAVLSIPLFAVIVFVLLRKLLRSKKRLQAAFKFAKVLGWILSFTFLFYMLLHGANFYRLSASELLGLDTSKKTAEQLKALCVDLAQTASRIRKDLPEDADGHTVLSKSISETLAEAGDGYKAIDDKYRFLKGTVTRAKPVRLSRWWSYTGISGMYFPFFVEANINIDQPDSAIPSTAAHELAHTRGFAREDECNFFACISCLNHRSPDYKYSGALTAYIYCSNALHAFDADMWKATREHCSKGVIRDIDQRAQYWKKFEGKVQKASNKINDGFIKSQGVADGVLSYNRVVELLLAYYQENELPEY